MCTILCFPHCATYVEKLKIIFHQRNISWNQIFTSVFCKDVVFTKFMSTMKYFVKSICSCSVEKRENLSRQKNNRQINSLVTYLVKPLLSNGWEGIPVIYTACACCLMILYKDMNWFYVIFTISWKSCFHFTVFPIQFQIFHKIYVNTVF